MRVGEILLEHEWVDWETLALALGDQRATRMRLCSLLVARRQLDFDQASLALAEQHGVAAVLRKHLVHRDRSAASLLPSRVARGHFALPIGRLGNGTLIVCVRDPLPARQAELSRILREPIVLAVAPARYVEQLVERIYAEIDVPIDVELPPADDPAFDFEVELEAADDDDNIRVEIEEPSPAKPKSRSLPVEIKRAPTATPVRDPLDTLIESLPDIDDLEWLFDVVMGYVTTRWSAALIVGISERRAVGIRGHGRRLKPSATRGFVMPLAQPSLVQLARNERRVVSEAPSEPGLAHATLLNVLDDAGQPLAAPLLTSDEVSHVLVVGNPLEGHPEDAVRDLEALTEAISESLTRIRLST